MGVGLMHDVFHSSFVYLVPETRWEVRDENRWLVKERAGET